MVAHRQLLSAVTAGGHVVQGADLLPLPDDALLLQQVRAWLHITAPGKRGTAVAWLFGNGEECLPSWAVCVSSLQ